MTGKTSLKVSTTNSDQTEVLLFNTQIVNIDKHHPKIKDFGDDGMKELYKRLNTMIFALGFKNPVESQVIKAMGVFIQSEFGNFCLEDLAIAFRKAAAGKLSIDVKHYQTFDMQYLGDVCKAYTKYRKEQLKLAKDHDQERDREAEISKSISMYGHSGKGWYNIIDKIVKKSGKLPIFGDWNAAYKFAETEGIIKPTIKEKSEFLKAVIIEMHREIVNHELSINQRQELRDALASKSMMKKECRARYMKKYFTDKIGSDAK